MRQLKVTLSAQTHKMRSLNIATVDRSHKMRQQKNVAEGSEIWVDYSSGGHTLGSQVPLRECYPGTPATLTASRRHMG